MVQIFLVHLRVDAKAAFLVLVQTPANIIVAAQIIHKPAVFRQAVQHIQLGFQQTNIPAGQSAPQVDHHRHIVQHVTFRLFRRAVVGGQLPRRHDHLAFEDHRRADTFQHHAQHPHNGMHLGQIAAAGAQLFPDIGYRVDAQHLHAQIGKVQDAFDHLHKHRRIAVIQIPLVGVEGGQHPLVHLLIPCEVARRGVGEHLRHGALVLVGNGAVLKAVVIRLIGAVPRLGPHGPFVGVGSVVHHHIQTQADARFAQLCRQRGQVLIGAEGRVHLLKTFHRVAAVIVGMGHFQQRHQVQIGQLLFLQIGQFSGKGLQVPREQVGIHGHAEHIAPAIPVRVRLAGGIQTFQFFAAFLIGLPHGVLQRVQPPAVIVQFHKQPVQLVLVTGQTGGKHIRHKQSLL